MITKTVLDAEWHIQYLEDGRKDGTPYNEKNYLVSLGYIMFNDDGEIEEGYLFADDPLFKSKVQSILDRTDLLINHNIKSDLNWLYECGFVYNGKVFDTLIAEYVLARGVKWQLSLKDCCIRRGTSLKKSELVEEYHKNKIGFGDIPKELVEEYGRQDVRSTKELYEVQVELYGRPRNTGLLPTLKMMNEFLLLLSEVERNGMYINSNALRMVELGYIQEKQELLREINSIVGELVGDTPCNLSSPAQLSELIYSRRILDKKAWAKEFNIGTDERNKPLRRPRINPKELKEKICDHTFTLYRTVADQCTNCGGTGRLVKFTKTGQPYKNAPKCSECDGTGICYTNTKQIAGLALGPRNINDLTANGFSTDKEMLEYLSALPRTPEIGKRLLKGLVRLNAIETYLSSFVGGIRRNTRANKLLHTSLNQTVTATARLSSSDPNLQNIPRGQTFPVKRAFRSRFVGGYIMEGDGMQLEFRTAAGVSECSVMLKEIWDKVDIHAHTAKVLTEAGQPTSRQEAKSRSFRPLFGGQSGTPAEIVYNKHFMEKYTGLAKWHEKLLTDACFIHIITSPSGREYNFPYAKKTFSGWVDGQTQIKNYIVQGFATGDYIPIVCLRLWKLMKSNNLKSLIINTVHDSVIVDVYPGEQDIVADLMVEAFIGAKSELKDRYGYDFDVPLGVEIKVGRSWLSMTTVREYDEVKELKHE